MRRYNKGVAVLAAAASLMFSTTSVAAQARVAPARATPARAATQTQGDAQVVGAPVWLLALLGAVAVAAGIAIAVGDDDDDDQSPESP